jgi:probable F420-dependent oxidoreductase
MTIMDELGFYTLAGQPKTPRELIDEVHQGEAMGFGSVFISERYNIKEAATLSGAAGAVSERIAIATAATNHNTRHPIITASYATTMHRLTGGRFTLGLGRGIAPLQDAYGIPRITTAQLEDFVGLMRRLWHGEVVFGHDGPAGRFPLLHLDSEFDEDIPVGFTAFGPNSLALGGRIFDQVVLHTFFTDETLVRCVETVKRSAEEAGRDPDDVQVWSCYATVGDHLPEPLRLKKTVGRLATYLQGYGDLLVSTNGGTRRCSITSAPTRWWPRCRAPSTRRRPPSSSSTSPRSSPTSGWRPRPPAARIGAPSWSPASSRWAPTA